MTTSRSPSAKHSSIVASWPVLSLASKETVRTLAAPSASSSRTLSARPSGSRAASTTLRQPDPTSVRMVACAMSLPPPSTSADCTAPSAFLTTGASLRGQHLHGEGDEDGEAAQQGSDDQSTGAHGESGARYSSSVEPAGRSPWTKRLFFFLGPWRFVAILLVDIPIWSGAMILAP